MVFPWLVLGHSMRGSARHWAGGTVDERLTAIFVAIGRDELAAVAASILADPQAQLQSVDFAEIKKPHADPRSIGIVRVSGMAISGGSERAWSTVTKLIDLAVPNVLGTPVDPRNEVLVYERGYFADGGGRMRPARCHHISRPTATLTILWLEDLTGAEEPPFSVGQLREMARHLGEWNARTAANPPRLDFPIGQDFYLRGAEGFNFPARALDLIELRDEPMMREMFARRPVEIAVEYISVYLELIERAKTLPHALSLPIARSATSSICRARQLPSIGRVLAVSLWAPTVVASSARR